VDVLNLIRKLQGASGSVAKTRKREKADGDADPIADQEPGGEGERGGPGYRYPEVASQGDAFLPDVERFDAQIQMIPVTSLGR
jgi:hypothetical protein